MFEEIGRQLIQAGFLPHGYCLSWSPPLVGAYIVSDVLISLAYFSMPLALAYFARRRTDFPFKWLLWMFATFILACGATHLMSTVILWQPLYWIDATLKAVTAAISVATAAVLWPMIPHALAIPSQTQLRTINEELHAQIAERQRTMEELEKRTAELTAANRELEVFTFATSHDLKGPLGRINNFGTLLELQYRDKLEGNGLIYLDFIRQNSTRLAQLVDDLMQHARVAQQALELKPVNVMSCLRVVLEENDPDIREANADVRADVPPVQAQADPQALIQVLSNLVQNALKYSANAHPPVIEIGGEVRGTSLLLWVRDNGIGFDMAYHNKIFEIFQRLHTHNEYEGSGVGLALVKRAMERMGGRVWADSKPGEGSIFFLEFQLATTS